MVCVEYVAAPGAEEEEGAYLISLLCAAAINDSIITLKEFWQFMMKEKFKLARDSRVEQNVPHSYCEARSSVMDPKSTQTVLQS
jgi:hypothetical protein